MLRTWWRQALVCFLFLLIASCSGGGCSSGCSSCGITPLAGGFQQRDTIANAGAVRVTKPGLEFLSQNIPALASKLIGGANQGVITFNVPTSNSSTSIIGININITVCPNGPNPNTTPPSCIAEIEIGRADLTISAVNPDSVTVSGTIPVRLRDLPVNTSVGGLDIALGNNLQCTNGTADADFKPIPITISLPLIAGTQAPREGYTIVDTKNAVFNIGLTQDDIQICSHCGALAAVCDGLLGFVKGLIFNPLVSQIQSTLTSFLDNALCTKSNPALTPACPTGSHPDAPDGGAPSDAGTLADGGAAPLPTYNCVYDTDPTTCVPMELGTDGHIELGKLLAKISPGTQGALDFVLASGGNMDPAPDSDAGANGDTPNGITLGMLGGALPQPQSDCVHVAPNPLPTGIPIPDEMKGDTVAGWTADAGPHLGVALNGRFLNYAMGSVYNSGLLCLGLSTENFQQLNTGFVSLEISSMKLLTFEEKSAPLAITTHPQQPPVVTIGKGTNVDTDPLIGITLPQFGLDFYVWSSDRYIRAFTYQADVTIPVTLDAQAAGIKPTLGKLGIANGTVTNNQLLTDDPNAVAGALGQVLSGFVGQLLGSGIPAINLSSALSSLGLSMTIPPGGITRLTKGNDKYVAIFANLAVPTSPSTIRPDTTAKPETMPKIRVAFGSPDAATQALEYSWRIDQGMWSAFSPEKELTIDDPILFMQANHVLQVSARIAGHPETQDETPAEVKFAIDVLPPRVKLVEKDGAPAIDAYDIVTPTESLVARVRHTDARGAVGEWSGWQHLADVVIDREASAVDVEVKDESENVGSVSSALIRGHPDGTIAAAGSGCSNGCTTGSRSRTEWPALLLALAALGLLFARRRGKSTRATTAALAIGSMVTLAGTTQGCGCGDDGGTGAPPTTGCGSDCNQPCLPGLPLGLVGSYTSIAKAKDGTIWVAGYDDAVIDNTVGASGLYGDLVVGRYDSGKQQVQWVDVDGMPAPPSDGTCPVNDPKGWRGGLTDTGDDVGLWTSIALDVNDHPMVAYYDATNMALKFASSSDGATWSTHAVFANAGSDVGRYAKMIVVNGKPIIAYSTIEKGTGGHTRSKVSLAHGNVATPASPGDWAIEDALVDDTGPCRNADDCDANQACVSGACVATRSDCSPACSATQACITQSNAAACVTAAQPNDLHPYPNGIGDYVALASAPQGLALVAYDRIHGNLLGLSNAGGPWSVAILDGETGSRANGTAIDTGDTGVGASLFVASNGDWHVSYVDGITETLKYLFVPGGTPKQGLTAQAVDDGSTRDGTTKFDDGVHVVGDDSFVRATDDGTVTITYQDATAGTLRLATGSSSATKWELKVIAQPNRFAGFFPHFVPGDTTIANWWRWTDPTTQNEFGDVAIVPAL